MLLFASARKGAATGRTKRTRAAARLAVPAVATLLAGGLLAGCGGTASSRDDGSGRVLTKNDDSTLFERADGMRVELRYRPGRGLTERHRRDGDWSAERFVHRTRTKPCRGITVRAEGELIAAIADFAPYCRDGDPPAENLAVVGSGHDLTDWAAKATRGSDGWEKIKFGDRRVEFEESWTSGSSILTWESGKGFGSKRTRYEQIRAAFIGTWKAEDGSHQLAFAQAGEERPLLTITSLSGAPCTVEVPVRQVGDTSVETRGEARVTHGSKQRFCPPKPFETAYELEGDDGSLALVDFTSSPRKHLMSYKRAR
ncbi:hypothetical protein ACFWC5_09295 [Streptomyces sp. NPDC060085]|uniref:hypothetical protein n=1 Tax=Streptomyces sp. NPDC060085 TaxID=3347054 RepID=UPI0036683A5F